MSPGSTSTPLPPSWTRSGMPPTRLPTTGRPRQKASTITRPIPSDRDGRTSSVDASSADATPLGVRRCVQSSARVDLERAARRSVQRPGADDVQPCLRACAARPAATLRPARRRSCSARARRRRAPADASGSASAAPEEGVEVHVGGKLVGRLEAELAHEPGRVAGHRSDAVGSAKRTERDAVRDRAQHAAQP